MIRELMDSLPLWNIMVFTMVVVLVAIEVGYRIGRWRNRSQTFESEGLLSAMTGAHLGLLAFIMAFSFSMASGHHTDRKKFILDEANVIETTHLRAQLMEEPYASEFSRLIREYAHLRTTIGSGADPAQLIADSEALHQQLWLQARMMLDQKEAGEIDALMVESLNSLFDIHEQRVAAGLRNRIPPSICLRHECGVLSQRHLDAVESIARKSRLNSNLRAGWERNIRSCLGGKLTNVRSGGGQMSTWIDGLEYALIRPHQQNIRHGGAHVDPRSVSQPRQGSIGVERIASLNDLQVTLQRVDASRHALDEP